MRDGPRGRVGRSSGYTLGLGMIDVATMTYFFWRTPVFGHAETSSHMYKIHPISMELSMKNKKNRQC